MFSKSFPYTKEKIYTLLESTFSINKLSGFQYPKCIPKWRRFLSRLQTGWTCPDERFVHKIMLSPTQLQ